MQAWRPSDLSWSISTKNHFESCLRHYFYHRFWGQDPELRWHLYEMRNISTLKMMSGQVAHLVIAETLKAIRMGEEPTINEARELTTTLMRTMFMESAKQLWHMDNRPAGRKLSSITNLLEHYYRMPNVEEQLREERRKVWRCLDNLLGSEFWRNATSAPSGWISIEEEDFPHFDVNGIKVFVRIDFAHKIGVPTLIDWKTGLESASDRAQLVLYAMYAQAKWGWNPAGVSLQVVYLQPELKTDTFMPEESDIVDVRRYVADSFGRLMALEPVTGPANIDDFPMTDKLSECRYCRFQGMCAGRGWDAV